MRDPGVQSSDRAIRGGDRARLVWNRDLRRAFDEESLVGGRFMIASNVGFAVGDAPSYGR